MSLQIISTDQALALKVSQILSHYFKGEVNNGKKQLNVKTKYYSCKVPIILGHLHSPNPELNKADLLLFLFDKNQQVSNFKDLIDGTINALQPESYLICVNVNQSSLHAKWQYEDELPQCDNFITAIYENVDQFQEMLPQWKGGLLMDEEPEEYELFSLFELIETTLWTNRQSLQNKHEMVPEVPNQEDEEKLLQKQMMEFEAVWQQIVQIKSTSNNNNSNDRKMRAENLIMKLAKNFD